MRKLGWLCRVKLAATKLVRANNLVARRIFWAHSLAASTRSFSLRD